MLNFTSDITKPDNLTKLATLAAKIAYYNFQWRFPTLVIFSTVQVIGIQTFLTNYNKPIIVKKGKFRPRYLIPKHQIVLFSDNVLTLSKLIKWLVRSGYDISSRFVIICSSMSNSCEEQPLFYTLSSLFIVNVVYITRNENGEPILFTYQPILQNNCNNYKATVLNVTYNCENDNCFRSMFPEKLKNFYKCPLIISAYEQPPLMYLFNNTLKEFSGGDGETLKLIVDTLNASLSIALPQNGDECGYYHNGNWTGSLGHVSNNLAHAAMCSTPLTPRKYENFQISLSYRFMDIVWIARLPTLKAHWEKLLYPLKFDMKIAIMIVYLFIICINALMKTTHWESIRKAVGIGSPPDNFILYSWMILLGSPLWKMPSKRILVMGIYCWIWFCFIIRNGYQAALIGSIKQRAYDNNFRTFNDIITNKLPYGGLFSLREYYSTEPEVYNNWILLNLNNSYTVLDTILDGRTNFILAINKEIVMNHMALNRQNNIRELQIIPEKIVNSPSTIIFKKDSPLATPVNRIIRRSVEGGLLEHLYTRCQKYGSYNLAHQEREPLTLEHFAGLLTVLICGFCLTTIVFVIEILYKKLNLAFGNI